MHSNLFCFVFACSVSVYFILSQEQQSIDMYFPVRVHPFFVCQGMSGSLVSQAFSTLRRDVIPNPLSNRVPKLKKTGVAHVDQKAETQRTLLCEGLDMLEAFPELRTDLVSSMKKVVRDMAVVAATPEHMFASDMSTVGQLELTFMSLQITKHLPRLNEAKLACAKGYDPDSVKQILLGCIMQHLVASSLQIAKTRGS